MGQLGKNSTNSGTEAAKQEVSYWVILLYLSSFILFGFLFLISLAFLLNGITPFNSMQNYSGYTAYIAAHLPTTMALHLPSSTGDTVYQIVLGELTLKGLITSLLGFIEYKIYEKLTALLCFAWKKATGKSRKFPRHKRK